MCIAQCSIALFKNRKINIANFSTEIKICFVRNINKCSSTSFPLLRIKSISSAVKLAIVIDLTRCGGFKPRLQTHNYVINMSKAVKKKF